MEMRGMLSVAAGVCLVSLAYVFLAIPSNEPVAFPTTIPAHRILPADFAPVSVKFSEGAAGHTTTLRLERGGRAAKTATSNAGAGFVGFRKTGRKAGSSP